MGQISKIFSKSKADENESSESRVPERESNQPDGFYEEVYVTKKVLISNSVTVSTKKCFESGAVKDILYVETDLPGDVVLHWGVCRNDTKRWEVPRSPYPPGTVPFKERALRTPLWVQNSLICPFILFYVL